MATRPELHEAVAKTKNKASEYNENFSMMLDYIDASIGEAESYVDGFMPSQTGHSGQFLKTNGTTASWSSPYTTNNTWSGTNKFNSTVTLASSVNCSGAATFTGTTKVPASTTAGTALQLNAQDWDSSNVRGYFKTGSGFLVQWGVRSSTGSVSVSFAKAYSSASSYSVTCTSSLNQNSATYAVTLKSKSSSGFSCYVATTLTGFTWIAIGK